MATEYSRRVVVEYANDINGSRFIVRNSTATIPYYDSGETCVVGVVLFQKGYQGPGEQVSYDELVSVLEDDAEYMWLKPEHGTDPEPIQNDCSVRLVKKRSGNMGTYYLTLPWNKIGTTDPEDEIIGFAVAKPGIPLPVTEDKQAFVDTMEDECYELYMDITLNDVHED